jgi:hypothetical protein
MCIWTAMYSSWDSDQLMRIVIAWRLFVRRQWHAIRPPRLKNTPRKRSQNRLRYEGISKSFRTGRLERELQMVEISVTRCSCIAILWVSLVSFCAKTLCTASQRVLLIVYFVIDSVRQLLDTPPYEPGSSEVGRSCNLKELCSKQYQCCNLTACVAGVSITLWIGHGPTFHRNLACSGFFSSADGARITQAVSLYVQLICSAQG